MKRILIVSYNKLDVNHKLPGVLELQPNVRKILETSWLIATTDTPSQFFIKIEPYINKDNDRIFIGEITKEYQGWLSRLIWEWVKENQG